MTLNSVTLRCALETKYNTKPKVDLKNPDITVIAEIRADHRDWHFAPRVARGSSDKSQ